MDLERYYLDLFEMLNSACKKIAAGKYEKSDADKLFELAKKGRYPSLLAELAESFGMMLVKVECWSKLRPENLNSPKLSKNSRWPKPSSKIIHKDWKNT